MENLHFEKLICTHFEEFDEIEIFIDSFASMLEPHMLSEFGGILYGILLYSFEALVLSYGFHEVSWG